MTFLTGFGNSGSNSYGSTTGANSAPDVLSAFKEFFSNSGWLSNLIKSLSSATNEGKVDLQSQMNKLLEEQKSSDVLRQKDLAKYLTDLTAQAEKDRTAWMQSQLRDLLPHAYGMWATTAQAQQNARSNILYQSLLSLLRGDKIGSTSVNFGNRSSDTYNTENTYNQDTSASKALQDLAKLFQSKSQ